MHNIGSKPDKGKALRNACICPFSIGRECAIGQAALLTRRDNFCDCGLKRWLIAPQARRESQRKMQIERADEDKINSRCVEYGVDILNRFLRLDLDGDHNLPI